jgi:hypothetical protein
VCKEQKLLKVNRDAPCGELLLARLVPRSNHSKSGLLFCGGENRRDMMKDAAMDDNNRTQESRVVK